MKYFKIILVLLLFFACKNNKIQEPKKPDNLLSENKMVEVIYDMSVVSAAKGVNKKLLEKEGIEPESYVYELHGIDSLQFAESSNYYTYKLEIYENIYANVKKKLQEDKVKFDTLVKVEKRRRDSINKSRKKTKKNKEKNKKRIEEIKKKNRSLKPGLLKKADTSQISTRH